MARTTQNDRHPLLLVDAGVSNLRNKGMVPALPLPGIHKGGRLAEQYAAQRQAPTAALQSVRSKHGCDRPVSTAAYSASTSGAPSTLAQPSSDNNRINGRFFPPPPLRHIENKTDEEKDITSHWMDFQPPPRFFSATPLAGETDTTRPPSPT